MAKKTQKKLKLKEDDDEKRILNLMNEIKQELENIDKNLKEMIEGLKNRNFSITRLKDLSIVINAKDANDPLFGKAVARLRQA